MFRSLLTFFVLGVFLSACGAPPDGLNARPGVTLSEDQIKALLRKQIVKYQSGSNITHIEYFAVDGRFHEVDYTKPVPVFRTALWGNRDNMLCKEYLDDDFMERTCFKIDRDDKSYRLIAEDGTFVRFQATTHEDNFKAPYPLSVLPFTRLLENVEPDTEISARNLSALLREARAIERYLENDAREKANARRVSAGFDPGAFIIAIYAATIFDEFQRFDLNTNRRLMNDAQRQVMIENKDQLVDGIDQLLNHVRQIEENADEIGSIVSNAVPNLRDGNTCQANLANEAQTLASDLKRLSQDAGREKRTLSNNRSILANARGGAQGDAILAGIFGVYAGLTSGSAAPANSGLGSIQTAAAADRRLANMGSELRSSQRIVQGLAQRASRLSVQAESLRDENRACQ